MMPVQIYGILQIIASIIMVVKSRFSMFTIWILIIGVSCENEKSKFIIAIHFCLHL